MISISCLKDYFDYIVSLVKVVVFSSLVFSNIFSLFLLYCSSNMVCFSFVDCFFVCSFYFLQLSSLVFFEFSGSMVRSLILGKFSAIITSNISSALFSLSSSDIQIVHRLYLLKLYHGSWMFCSVSLLLLLFIQLFFFGHVEFLEEPIRGIPHFCYCFFLNFYHYF